MTLRTKQLRTACGKPRLIAASIGASDECGEHRRRRFDGGGVSMYDYRSVDAEAVATARLTLSAVTADLRNVVEMVFGDLIAYFNIARVPSDYYDFALEEMLKHE